MNMPFRFIIITAVFFLAAATTRAGADWEIYTDEEFLTASSITPKAESLQIQGEEARELPWDSVLYLRNRDAAGHTSEGFVVDTAGNVFRGELSRFSETGVTQQSATLGVHTLPWSGIAAVGFDLNSLDREIFGDAPVIVLRNGDPLAGEIGEVGAEGVSTQSIFGSVEMAWSEIAAVVFQAVPDWPPDGGTSLLFLANGDEIRASELSGNGTWRAEMAGKGPIEVGADAVRQIWMRGTMVMPLTDLPSLQTPPSVFLGQEIPPRFHRGISGEPLALGSRVYRWGLGAHTPASIEATMPEGARWCVVEVGLDERMPPATIATFTVVVNGKERESVEVTAQADPAPLRVRVASGDTVEVRAATASPAGAWVVLGEPVLILR